MIYSGTKSARPTSYQKFSRRRSFCCRNLRETICHQYILLSAFVALLTVIITSVVTWKLTASNYAIPYEEAKSVLVDLSVFFLEPNLSGSTRSTRSDKPDSNPLEPAEDGRRNVCRLGSDQCRTALQARLLTPSNCRRPWQTEKWKLESMLAQQLNKSDLCGFYQCKEIRICCHEAATAENNLAKVIFKVLLDEALMIPSFLHWMSFRWSCR